MSNEALNHIGGKKSIDCPSMAVFLNTVLLLKYYHAHNIHHCSISNIGLGFCNLILKGKFLFIFNIFGDEIGRA